MPTSTSTPRRRSQGEEIDEVLGRVAPEFGEHGAPGTELQQATPLDAARHGFHPEPRGALQAVGLPIERRQQFPPQGGERPGQDFQRPLQFRGAVEQALQHRFLGTFQAVFGVGPMGAGQKLRPDQREEALGGTPGAALGQAPMPTLPRQAARGLQAGPELVPQCLVREIVQAPGEAAGAAATVLGAQQPAPQLGALASRDMGGEHRIGGIEQVVAFVEDVARGQRMGRARVVAERGLQQHQGVVGDHQIGAPGAAYGAFDEAAPVLRAGGVDAFAAPVGQPERAVGAEQLGQPAREIAAAHVAVAGGPDPARDKAQEHGLMRTPAAHGLGEVEQAQIVLAPLAHHHAPRLRRPLGVRAVELAVDPGVADCA